MMERNPRALEEFISQVEFATEKLKLEMLLRLLEEYILGNPIKMIRDYKDLFYDLFRIGGELRVLYITGGLGKTTFAKAAEALFPERIEVIHDHQSPRKGEEYLRIFVVNQSEDEIKKRRKDANIIVFRNKLEGE